MPNKQDPSLTAKTASYPITYEKFIARIFFYLSLAVIVSSVISWGLVSFFSDFHLLFLQYFLFIFGGIVLISTALSLAAGHALKDPNANRLMLQLYYLFNVGWLGFSLSFAYYFLDIIVLFTVCGIAFGYFTILWLMSQLSKTPISPLKTTVGVSLGLLVVAQMLLVSLNKFTIWALLLLLGILLVCNLLAISMMYSTQRNLLEIQTCKTEREIDKLVLWTASSMSEVFVVLWQIINKRFKGE